MNNQETERFRVDARVDERTLREIYLPAFEHVVKEAKPWALMCSYNKVNGTYASQNATLLTDILRTEWGFDGLVMSDWGAVVDRAAAVAAGLDLEMPPSHTDDRVVAAVRSGSLPAEAVEASAQRLIDALERTAQARAGKPSMQVDVDAGRTLARSAASQACVLLRNDGVLPLNPEKHRKLAVVGSFAAQPRFQGGGSSRVVPTSLTSVLDEFTSRGEFASVSYAPGFDTESSETPVELREEAITLVGDSDVAVVMVGLPDGAESEGSDRTTMALPQNQIDLLERVVETGTPVVVVISGGSVVELGSWHTKTAGLVEAWLLGQEGGAATVDVLMGDVDASGRLAESIPLTLADNPSYLHFPGTDEQVVYGEGLFVGYRYYDTLGKEVAYPFGFGLSYSTFEYSDAEVVAEPDGGATVSVSVRNVGERTGVAVVQVYVGTPDPSAPTHTLKGFERVELGAGESSRVHVALPQRAFARWDVRVHDWRVPEGEYLVEIASSSRDILFSEHLDLAGDGVTPPLTDMSTVADWLAHAKGRTVIAPLIEKAQAMTGGDAAPEMMAMFLQMPLIKMTAFGMGFSEEMLHAMLLSANS